MRVCMRVRMIVRTPPDTRPGPGPGPGHQRKREEGKPAYIGIIAGDEKKV